MLNKFERAFKIACLGLAGVMLYQVSGIVLRSDPLTKVRIPDVPTLANASAAAASSPARSGTNSPARADAGKTNSPDVARGNPGMRSGARSPAAQRASDLSPLAQARIEKITQSEILGPVIRPLPMALLGIAGKSIFFRAPNGQTGVIKEGDELGGVKLLRIGTNRVLVDQDGQNKELTIFQGYGGESLLPKDQEISK